MSDWRIGTLQGNLRSLHMWKHDICCHDNEKKIHIQYQICLLIAWENEIKFLGLACKGCYGDLVFRGLCTKDMKISPGWNIILIDFIQSKDQKVLNNALSIPNFLLLMTISCLYSPQYKRLCFISVYILCLLSQILNIVFDTFISFLYSVRY